MEFAFNHMSAPRLSYGAFLDMAASCGAVGVEFRNDLPGGLFGGADPRVVRAAARSAGQRILALAEIKAFNDVSDSMLDAARRLIATARECGAEAVSLIPSNDGPGPGHGARQARLRLALREIRPLLDDAGLAGLVEPLGFDSCTLRTKAETVDAIEAIGGAGTYRLVHDTFHHHLAGETGFFAGYTGIVHVSGVTDPRLAVGEMRDRHRVLVDHADRLGNIEQLARLAEDGYAGPISFEPFAPEIHALTDPASALRHSMDYIANALADKAA